MDSQPPSLQGSTPHEAREQDHSEPPTKKRKRKTLACYDCRRRKLKCDRIYPACGRCVRAGQPNQCHYETLPDNANDGSSVSEEDDSAVPENVKHALCSWVPKPVVRPPPKPASQDTGMSPYSAMPRGGKFEQLEERLARLESMSKPNTPEATRAAMTNHAAASSPYTPPGSGLVTVETPRERSLTEVEMMFFKGKGFATQFYGASNPTSMISQFPELRAFMKAAIRQYPSLARMQSDLKGLNVSLKIEQPKYDTPLSVALLNQVPERSMADHLISLYITNIESLYRILHIPTFYNEYETFWTAPQNARPVFVAIMLLMMASMSSLASNGPKTFIGRSSQARETAARWVQTVADWMAAQSRKHIAIENFQIWLLLVIAKHMNIIKKKRFWEVAADVIKKFMGAGMHRDPSLLGRKITFYDQEMRRRLWATAVEIDLLASLSRGMPSSVAANPSDAAAPMNIDDKMFDETALHPPRTQPNSEISDTSFLHISSQSLRLRISLASLVNDPGARVEYEEVLKWEERIKQQLDAIPNWSGIETTDPKRRAQVLLTQVLLDAQLRQYLIWLHFPYASRTGSESQNNYSRTVCFNNACMIVDQHSRLMEQEIYSLCLLRSDAYLAAMTICHNVFASSLHRNNMIFNSLTTAFGPSLEKCFKMQEEKIMRLGEGRNHYWFISAAQSFVQAKISPDLATAAKQQSVDRVTRLFYRILTGQEDFRPNGQPKTPPVDAGAKQPFQSIVPVNPKDAELEQVQIGVPGAEFDPFQHLDPAEWALDNLWPMDNNLDWTQF